MLSSLMVGEIQGGGRNDSSGGEVCGRLSGVGVLAAGWSWWASAGGAGVAGIWGCGAEGRSLALLGVVSHRNGGGGNRWRGRGKLFYADCGGGGAGKCYGRLCLLWSWEGKKTTL